MPLAPGARVAGYRVEALLGEGGMGAVYRATDVRLGRTVALKVIAQALPDDESLGRFRREARALAAIKHPNVLALHEASWEGAVAWLALELALGGSLAQRIKEQGRLPWRDVARTGAEIARGLAAAHALGIVHRDLKPANVLFDESGRAKVGDFGLVAAAGTLVESRRLTATGEIVGTPEYLSPEQANGEPASAASDLFSLGATLHAALAGRPPFEGRGPALLCQILRGTPLPLRKIAPDVPPELEALVLRLLEKTPAKRPTAGEAAATLEAIAAGSIRRRRPRWPWALAPIAVGFVLLARRDPGAPPSQAPATSSSPGPIAKPAASAPPRAFPVDFASFAASKRGLARLTDVFGEYAWKCGGLVTALELSPDLASLLVASEDGSVKLLDPSTGDMRRMLELRATPRLAATFSRDGALVATGGSDGIVRVIETASGKLLRESDPLGGPVRTLAFLPEGGVLFATASLAGVVEGKDVTALVRSDLSAVAFAGDRFATAERDVVTLRDRSGNVLAQAPADLGTVRSLLFSPDGRAIVAASEAGVVVLREATGGLARQPLTIRGRGAENAPRGLSFRDDKTLLVSTAGVVGVWQISIEDGAEDDPIMVGRGFAETRIAAVRGRAAAALSLSEEIVRLDLAKGEVAASPRGHALGVADVAVGRDGAFVVSSAKDGTVRTWRKGHEAAERTIDAPGGREPKETFVALSPDERELAIGMGDGVLRLATIQGEDVAVIPATEGLRLEGVAFSPTGGGLVTAIRKHGEKSDLAFWTTGRSPRFNRSVPVAGPALESVAWPTNDTIVAANTAGTLTALDLVRTEVLPAKSSLDAHHRGVSASPEGREVVAWGETLAVYDVAFPLELRRRLEGHAGEVFGAALSERTGLVVSAGRDRTIRLWSAEGAEVDRIDLDSAADWGNCVAFAADGRSFAVGTQHGVVLLYAVERP